MKTLLVLAIPIMMGNFLQTLYNLIDTFYLGKLGKAAISAPVITFNVIFVIIAIGTGLSLAGTTLISQSKGKGDREKEDFYLGQLTVSLTVFALAIAIIGYFVSEPILKLLKTPQDTFNMTKSYMQIIFLGSPFMFGMFLFTSAFQGIGDTITPLKVQGVAIILNLILDPLFIFGIGPFPKLGVTGAAIATVLSRSVGSLIGIFLLIRGRHGIKLRKKYLKPSGKAIKLMFEIGIPASIGNIFASIGFTVLQGIVNTFGSAVVAAFGVGNRIVSLFNMPGMGIGRAVTILVGQSLGAENIKRAKQSVKMGVLVIGTFLTIGMTLTFFYGNYFVKFFIPNDPEVLKLGEILFRIISPSVIFFGIFMVISGAFQGAGDTKPVMILSIVRLWGIRVPFAYILSKTLHMGATGIWLAMFLSNIIVSIWGLFWFRTGRWITHLDRKRI